MEYVSAFTAVFNVTGRRGGPQGQMGTSDGWNTVGGQRTPLKNVDRSIDISKMKFSKVRLEIIL